MVMGLLTIDLQVSGDVIDRGGNVQNANNEILCPHIDRKECVDDRTCNSELAIVPVLMIELEVPRIGRECIGIASVTEV